MNKLFEKYKKINKIWNQTSTENVSNLSVPRKRERMAAAPICFSGDYLIFHRTNDLNEPLPKVFIAYGASGFF